MNTTNTLRTTLLAGLMALGVAGTALAQSPAATAGASSATAAADGAAAGRHGHAATMQERQARRSAHMAKRQAKLHDALKLTATQESAWSSYQSALRPAQAAVHGNRGDRAGWAALSAPARMEKRLAMAKQRTARMETRLAALNTFYGVLTAEQKKTFDEVGMRGKGHRGGHHGHHGHHGKGKIAQV